MVIQATGKSPQVLRAFNVLSASSLEHKEHSAVHVSRDWSYHLARTYNAFSPMLCDPSYSYIAADHHNSLVRFGDSPSTDERLKEVQSVFEVIQLRWSSMNLNLEIWIWQVHALPTIPQCNSPKTQWFLNLLTASTLNVPESQRLRQYLLKVLPTTVFLSIIIILKNH